MWKEEKGRGRIGEHEEWKQYKKGNRVEWGGWGSCSLFDSSIIVVTQSTTADAMDEREESLDNRVGDGGGSHV